MKIYEDYCNVPSNGFNKQGIFIDEFEVTYSQEPDTNSDRDEFQRITFFTLDNGCGKYCNIKIPEGYWSFDNVKELIAMYYDFCIRSGQDLKENGFTDELIKFINEEN